MRRRRQHFRFEMPRDDEVPAGMQERLMIGQTVEQGIGEIGGRRGRRFRLMLRLRFNGRRRVDGQRLRFVLPGLVRDRRKRRRSGLMGNFPRLALRFGCDRIYRFDRRFNGRFGIDRLFVDRLGLDGFFR